MHSQRDWLHHGCYCQKGAYSRTACTPQSRRLLRYAFRLQIATKVSGGSYEALRSLCLLLEKEGLSESHLKRLFSALEVNFEECRQPQDINEEDPRRRGEYSISMMALVSMSRMIDKFITGTSTPALGLLQRITAFWPTFCRWLPMLLKDNIENARLPMDYRRRSRHVVLEHLDLYMFAVQTHLPSLPEVAILVAKMWMLEIEGPPIPSVHSTSKLPVNAAATLCNVLRKMDETEREAFDDLVVRQLGPTTVAKVALGHLRDKYSAKSYQTGMGIDISVVHAFAVCYPVAKSLLSQGSIAACTKTAIKLAEAPEPLPSPRAPEIQAAFRYILASFNIGNGFTWIIEALNAQILRAMLRSAHLPDLGEDIVFLLSKVLPPYMIYESVLVAVGRAVNRVKDLGLLKRNTLAPIRSTWAKFLESYSSAMFIAKRRALKDPIGYLGNRCSYQYVSIRVQSF